MTALNFPDSPSNGDTYQGYTYNSTKGTWAKPDSPDPDARTAVYANIAALPTSGTAGDMAYVTATNRLYIWTGTGWYNIALINTNPTISGVSSSYALEIDGSATTVTITATDPEGIPITYSIASDTSGNIATVAQGTGGNTNVFTITPSTNTAHAGTFSLTFRASDGVNIASAAASFTLQFKVQNSKYTTALITSVGANNAVNSSFDDKSTSDHTITANGDAHQTTFSPYRHGGYSVYCDGNDAVKFNETGADEFTFGTGDFTMEGWFWIDLASIAASGEHTLIGNNGTDGEMWFSVIGSTWGGPKYNLQTGTGSGWANTISSGANTVKLKQWVHLAVVRISGTVNIYENGVSVANGSNTVNIPNSNNMLSFMGRPQTYGQYATGYIHDVRITKGTGVYTSGFTPPTEKMEAVTNTKLLALRKPYIVDESASPLSVTVDTGDPSTKPFAPYDYSSYAAENGGSIACDGSGDSIQITGGSDFTFTGDFTAECWVYCNAHTNDYAGIFGFSHDSQSTGWNILGRSNGKLHFNVGMTYTDATGSLPLNQWVHLALVRNGSSSGNCKLYINGVADATTVTKTGTVTQPTFIQIGQYPGIAARAFNGNIADVRVVNGTAVYTSNFTPTTAPLTAITNTKLLVQSTDAGIIDKAQTPRFVKLLGNTKSSTTQTKFLSSSMYFDGTGDYIEADDQDIGNFGSGDFTAEGWFYLTASPSNYITIAETRGSGGSTTGWVMAISAGDFYVYSGAFIGAKGSAISSNTWYHWAFTRSGTDQKVFLNGTQTGSTYTTARNYTDNNFTIGAKHDASEFFTGYQSDVRITKDLARYTANFTPPTAALEG